MVTNAGYMAVLLRDARILVFDHQAPSKGHGHGWKRTKLVWFHNFPVSLLISGPLFFFIMDNGG